MDPTALFPSVSPATFLCLTPGLWEGGADLPGRKLVKIRQEVTDAEACPGSFGGVSWSDSLLGGANTERCTVGVAEGPG